MHDKINQSNKQKVCKKEQEEEQTEGKSNISGQLWGSAIIER